MSHLFIYFFVKTDTSITCIVNCKYSVKLIIGNQTIVSSTVDSKKLAVGFLI